MKVQRLILFSYLVENFSKNLSQLVYFSISKRRFNIYFISWRFNIILFPYLVEDFSKNLSQFVYSFRRLILSPYLVENFSKNLSQFVYFISTINFIFLLGRKFFQKFITTRLFFNFQIKLQRLILSSYLIIFPKIYHNSFIHFDD